MRIEPSARLYQCPFVASYVCVCVGGGMHRLWLASAGPCPRDALEGGEPPPPPSGAPSLRPATVPLTPSASLNGICNRQYPPPTALAAPCNRLPNRSWGPL